MQPELPEHEVIGPAAEDGITPIRTNLADVEPEPVNWLWPGRIALGKLHLVAGDAGLGKSTVTCDIAARVTTGAEWPDGTGEAPLGDVLIMSAEDDPRDTIRPRMDAAGADVRGKRVHLLEGKRVTVKGKTSEYGVTLEDVGLIERAIRDLPDVKLLIVDPVAAYLGQTDSHKESEVRGLLAALDKLARKYSLAVVLVSHLNKANTMKALYRVSGSQGFTNAVRLSWLVAVDPSDPDRRVLARLKGNVSEDPGAVAFRLRKRDGDLMAHVEWIEGKQEVDIEALLAPPARESQRQRGTREDAKDYLITELADGRRLQSDLEENSPVSPRTLKTAKRELGVISTRPGGSGPWWWELPGSSLKDASAPPNTSAPLHPSPEGLPDSGSKLEGKSANGAGGTGASLPLADFNPDDVDRLADEQEGQ